LSHHKLIFNHKLSFDTQFSSKIAGLKMG